MVHKEVTERLRVVETKEATHYLNKLEKDLVESLGKRKGEIAFGALRTIWYRDYIDKEDIQRQTDRTYAELFIMNISGIIKDSTYEGLKEQLHEIYKDTIYMPI